MAFGPNGLLASGSDGGTMRLWDASAPDAPRPLGDFPTGHTGPVLSVAFGPDGLLASGDHDGIVRLCDVSLL
ncbi:WD40 repeat domain-containing protein [Pseudofrankia sp. EUN1h]|uniref:WD40 repeat domain-containing protein n=2 Tax=Pseudofrankia TaxID=2994363 RepID=UPI0009F2E94A|nr:hypothetical protein [Pseudofrankia sp. EUN1h]